METKICLNCKKVFSKDCRESRKNWLKTKFCSKKCHYAYGKVNLKCEVCHKSFIVHRYRSTQRFCSCKCRAKILLPPSRGTSVEIVCKKCGRKKRIKTSYYNQSKNHFCSSKCSNAYLGKLHSGKNHWNWKGGVSRKNHRRETSKYKLWRKAVYQRDFWTCQDCGVKQKHPIAHHLKDWKEYPKLRYSVKNGITVCRSCHKKRHEEIGNSTRFTSS